MDRPILFSAPMVRAILEGRKTQTRRVLKPDKRFPSYTHLRLEVLNNGTPWWWDGVHEKVGVSQPLKWQSSDILWVREAWGINDYRYGGKHPIPKARPSDLDDDHMVYAATETDAEINAEMPMR